MIRLSTRSLDCSDCPVSNQHLKSGLICQHFKHPVIPSPPVLCMIWVMVQEHNHDHDNNTLNHCQYAVLYCYLLLILRLACIGHTLGIPIPNSQSGSFSRLPIAKPWGPRCSLAWGRILYKIVLSHRNVRIYNKRSLHKVRHKIRVR